MLRRTALGLVLALLLALPATAQDHENALAAFKRGNYAVALREWQPLAKNADPSAQFNLGLMYTKGLGVPQDYTRALVWYRKAAKQGNADAQNNLGYLYSSGLGVPQDYARALIWYSKAAKQGHAYARINLHVMHLHGRAPKIKAPAVRNPGNFRIQLSSFKSKALAEKEAVHLSRIYKPYLNSLKITVVRADLGQLGNFYRLQAGPFAERSTADNFCGRLSTLKQGCIVIKP